MIDPLLDNALNSIQWYAEDHKLTPKQVKAIFLAGVAACVKAGTLKFPSAGAPSTT
ncbi:MAG TPA: hypothetical protein VMI10_10655 [Terriglobales bacterium]|nr:hypothetical protein [Terriglobales bacterium]